MNTAARWVPSECRNTATALCKTCAQPFPAILSPEMKSGDGSWVLWFWKGDSRRDRPSYFHVFRSPKCDSRRERPSYFHVFRPPKGDSRRERSSYFHVFLSPKGDSRRERPSYFHVFRSPKDDSRRERPSYFHVFRPPKGHPTWTSFQIGSGGNGGGTRFVSFNGTQCRVVTGLRTGHSTLRSNLHLMGLTNSHLCWTCGVEEHTSAHIVCECEGLASRISGLIFLGPRGR